MESLDQVKKLREDYEKALDAAESRRVAYHEAVLDLHHSGTPLREIAKELGLSHQRVHQIVSGEPPRKRNLGRAAGAIGGALILIAATFGALRIAHAPPFVQTVRVPTAKYWHAVVIDPTTGDIVSRYLVRRH
jgi:predicted transcriptional regulator